MKVKVAFLDQMHRLRASTETSHFDHLIIVENPVKMTHVNGEPLLILEDGREVHYEVYCQQLESLINKVIDSRLSKIKNCRTLVIEGFKEAHHFMVICSAILNSEMTLFSQCNITIRDCAFAGPAYINPLIQLCEHFKKQRANLSLHITIHNKSKAVQITVQEKQIFTNFPYITLFTGPEVKPNFIEPALEENSRPKCHF